MAFTASLYAFGEGAIDEFGDPIPFLVMAALSLLASGIYVVSALLIWVLLREGNKPAVTASPGWYPDPGDPSRRRFWDGTAWTDQITPAEEAPHRTA